MSLNFIPGGDQLLRDMYRTFLLLTEVGAVLFGGFSDGDNFMIFVSITEDAVDAE